MDGGRDLRRRASIRDAVPSMFEIAQTAPGAGARLKTRGPTSTRLVTVAEAGSIPRTLLPPRPPAHTLPPAAASP